MSGEKNTNLMNSISKKSGPIDDGVLSLDDIYRVIDLYFKQKNIMFTHLYNSFDKFLDEDIHFLLKKGTNTFFEKTTPQKVYRYSFEYENISIKPPVLDNGDELMFPQHARTSNLTYSVKLVANIRQVQETIDIATGTKTKKQVGDIETEYPVATIPVMVRSKYCSINLKKDYDHSECDYDPGGYFIVNGAEKAVMALERMIDNKPLVFIKKDSSSTVYNVQVNSKNYTTDQMQIIKVVIKKDNTLIIKVPILAEVPVFILMRALGIESDKDIINYVVYDKNDHDMINLVRVALENSRSENTNIKISTSEEAVNYLINKMKVIKRYNETDKDIRMQEKKMHLKSLLQETFLPHVEGGMIKKAYFLGYMINRLLQCYFGRIPIDDRDSFINKRVDLPGTLMYELFKQFYKKMLNECNKFFRKRLTDDDNPPNIINQIKHNVIEQGLKSALMTGAWGKRKGVAQMLQRLSYLQTLSSLRRINSPTVDASTNKLTGPRHLSATSVPSICYIETPEGHKVGLVKNLSMIGNVTVMMSSQIFIIKSYLKDKLINVQDVAPENIKQYTRVFLNGEWLGLTDKPRDLYNELKQMKYNGDIDAKTSIIHEIKSEIECKELKVYCDGGRLFHPVFRVKNNELLLKKAHIDTISLDEKKGATLVTTWTEFMAKNPGIIEYIDTDEQYNSMSAVFQKDVINMKKRSDDAEKMLQKMNMKHNEMVINRYDDFTFVEYTHCEIHPSLFFGCVVSNIPFANCNQSVRNTFQYSQARQAMGIYATNYRDRADISYILYNTQRPLVTTRSQKYYYTDKIPYGENAIVAIMCYSGYNQEDSVIMNQSAVDCGFMRCTSLKKYQTTIQKNQSTSQDDVFRKPDKTKVVGMKLASYDKLNEDGIVPEETRIENNDVIIGKISPIQPIGNSTKTFKDSSEIYKAHVSGAIDRVWTKIYNAEGYEMRKVRIRSERIPHIGDKTCSRHGQKGTIGITLPASDMPFTKNGIQPDLCVNPNAIKIIVAGRL